MRKNRIFSESAILTKSLRHMNIGKMWTSLPMLRLWLRLRITGSTSIFSAMVDTFEPEEEIDLNEVAAEIRRLQAEIRGIDAELKPYFDELGLDFPFEVEGR